MIYFQRRPDPVFLAILHEALELFRDNLRTIVACAGREDLEDEYPLVGRCFTAGGALSAAERLLAISRDAEVHRITDYHWLLLYECLWSFCSYHNAEAEEGRAWPVGGFPLREIDFVGLVEIYFWDTDFLIASDVMERLGLDVREGMGISPEAYGIAEGWAPHEGELRFERVGEPEWFEGEPMEFYRPGSIRYPDYPTEAEMDGASR